MAWLPYIRNYKPFYIECVGDLAAWSTTDYGLVAKTNPYLILPNPKEPYNNDWKDEDGDDEYVASMHYEAFTFQVGFYVKTFDSTGLSRATATDLLRMQMAEFFAKIKEGEFKVFDSYTGVGRQHVRYAGYEEVDGGFVSRDNWARIIFNVTFKVNDPVTIMRIVNNHIVALNI